MVEVTIEYKPSSEHPMVGLDKAETVGLHEALGFIEDRFVRAKDGLGPEVSTVVLATRD